MFKSHPSARGIKDPSYNLNLFNPDKIKSFTGKIPDSRMLVF
ncbi:hypothetical protein NITUZ_30132 [Candidatus Nitrosotenuis uzonensis]|uniref:Uncharacterized protein n=1 Tax=Candidatus Nitrosotenuis uzonensis TaxID=1407055 RepID=V6ASD0_9ARCH|nr:hypothetical protein NITUZ_30132 [Candidatus Nitrosotenuis uzonensis]